jgi:O-antigen/teichoic acid export membrane protein
MQFSFYSFAVYVVVTVYTVLNAANNVIFPYLKRLSKTDVGKKYLFLKKISFLLFVFSLPCFVLCHILIERLMNAYAGALPYMDILIFSLLFRLLGGVACANTMKAMDMEREYFICNLTACIMAFAADVAAYLLFHDLKAIAAASVAVYALWYVMCDMRIKRRLNEDTKRKI